jgi:imidazolonepropionase-like amidohydrolase
MGHPLIPIKHIGILDKYPGFYPIIAIIMGNDQLYRENSFTLTGVYPAGSSRPVDIAVQEGTIRRVSPSATRPAPGEPGLWVSPGLIDVHTHLAWTDFDPADQADRDAAGVLADRIRSYTQTVLTGVTAIRDAGGLSRDLAALLREKAALPLDIHLSVDMLDAADARGPGYLTRRVAELAEAGAEWIKLMVTGGVGSPGDEALNPRFSREEIGAVIAAAHGRGLKVMAHAWGGIGLDWVIQEGIDSVEHGVYMTAEQARALALSGGFLVPTAAIYRLVAEGPAERGGDIRQRAARAAEAHPRAIRRAREAGVPLALGTDFGGPEEHGRNLMEIDALVSCGLSREEAWTAATEAGAALLGQGGRMGAVKPGYRADLLVFTGDPHRTDAAALEIAGVIAGGRVLRAGDSLTRCIKPPEGPEPPDFPGGEPDWH